MSQPSPTPTAKPADDRPVVLYDTTLRDGTQGENIILSLADKLRIARMLDEYGMPYIEGGWPGSNPKDIDFFAAARKQRWAERAAGRLRLDPAPRQPARRTTRTCASSSPPRRRWSRSSARAGCSTSSRSSARPRPENLDMIADSIGFVADRGREVVYDAEHFFDGYRDDPAYALATLRAAREAGARTLVLCDTNGGTLTDELLRIVGEVRASARRRRRTRRR